MKKLLIAAILLATVGCTSRYQHQMDQSLLLQENQRLEEALYVTHTQLVDLKRENEALKAMQIGGSGSPTKAIAPAIRPRRAEPTPRDDYDEAPPYQAPKVTIPDNAPVSDTLPDALKSSQRRIMPPNRQYASQNHSTVLQPEEITLPALPVPVLPVENGNHDDPTPPAWSPTRN